MSDILGARSIIQAEDIAFGASVSEATGNLLGETLNFHSKGQYKAVNFKFSNDLGAFETGLEYADGCEFLWHNVDIVGYGLSVGQNGSAGHLEIDIMRLTAPGATPSSIFSTTPRLTYQSGSNAYLYKNLESLVVKEPSTPASFTHGVLSVSQLNEGDVIFPKLVAGQNGAIDAQLTLFLRIR
jgi:hypothetical protein